MTTKMRQYKKCKGWKNVQKWTKQIGKSTSRQRKCKIKYKELG